MSLLKAILAFQSQLLASRVASRFDLGPGENGERPGDRREVGHTIDWITKDLNLVNVTWSALRQFKKDLINEDATKGDVRYLLEDFEFEEAKVRDKKDAKSKKQLKQIGNLMTLLKGDSVQRLLK